MDARDGRIYVWARIGAQSWMAENLTFRTASGSWCHGDDEARCREYGRLYDWATAQTACPQGWRLPGEEDWNALATALGREPARQLVEGGGSGFEAKMAGDRYYDGRFRGLGSNTHFWTNQWSWEDHAFVRIILRGRPELLRSGFGVVGAVSVRCVAETRR